MNQLDKLRDEKAKEWENTADQYSEKFLVKTGWDAHEALNLPVLFAEWCNMDNPKDKRQSNTIYVANSNKYWYNYKQYTTKELYDYWINNIYKPE